MNYFKAQTSSTETETEKIEYFDFGCSAVESVAAVTCEASTETENESPVLG